MQQGPVVSWVQSGKDRKERERVLENESSDLRQASPDECAERKGTWKGTLEGDRSRKGLDRVLLSNRKLQCSGENRQSLSQNRGPDGTDRQVDFSYVIRMHFS